MPTLSRCHSLPAFVFVEERPGKACAFDRTSERGEVQPKPKQRPADLSQRVTPAELAAAYRRRIVEVEPHRGL